MKINLKPFFRINTLLAWSAFLIWASVITCLSSLTSQDLQAVPSEMLASDKLVHAVAFAFGGTFLGMALRRTTQLCGGWLFLAIVVGIGLFGAIDEIHQLYTPDRSGADFYDWVADMVGGSIAAFVYCLVYGHARPKTDAAGSPEPDPAAP